MMILIVVLTISFTTTMAKSPAKATKSIVEIAVSNDDFSILVEALSKAELVDALSTDIQNQSHSGPQRLKEAC